MDSVSSRQFREFRDFSAIAENHCWCLYVSQMILRLNICSVVLLPVLKPASSLAMISSACG